MHDAGDGPYGLSASNLGEGAKWKSFASFAEGRNCLWAALQGAFGLSDEA
jgi:hypothetical protein